jgi:hypothetical protein
MIANAKIDSIRHEDTNGLDSFFVVLICLSPITINCKPLTQMTSLATTLQAITPQELDLFLATLPPETVRNLRIKYNLPLPSLEQAVNPQEEALSKKATLKRPKTAKKDMNDSDRRNSRVMTSRGKMGEWLSNDNGFLYCRYGHFILRFCTSTMSS